MGLSACGLDGVLLGLGRRKIHPVVQCGGDCILDAIQHSTNVFMIGSARSVAKCFHTRAGMPSGARAFVPGSALRASVKAWRSNGATVIGSVLNCGW